MTIHQILQGHAGEVLHNVVEDAVVGKPIIEDSHGVVVGERRHRLDSALKASERDGVIGYFRADQFKGAGAAQEAMFRQEDLAHAPFAQLAFERVLPQFARLQGFALHAPEVDSTRKWR